MRTYKRGDLVKVNNDSNLLSKGLAINCEGVIERIYSEAHPGAMIVNERYSLVVQGRGELAFYDEADIEFLESNRFDLLGQWLAE